ncbi:MAG: SGNH/GDSL hydrolase family protein [Abitibacteriaceae bacterium]|nr:SGNH/GDSL hydrolase family protein [Abditibacteriaceae bacterium]
MVKPSLVLFLCLLFCLLNSPADAAPTPTSVTAARAPAPSTATASTPPLLQGVHRIVTMGASITQFGSSPGGYVWLLGHYLNALYPQAHIQIINAGVSGNTSADMLARFQKDVLEQHPDLVTIKLGYNDLTLRFQDHPQGDGPQGASAEDYGKNAEAMVKLAQAAHIRILLMTPTIYEDSPKSIRNQKLQAYVRVMQDLAANYHLPLADQNAALLQAWLSQPSDQPQRLTTDGVHLTPTGNQVLARTTLLAMGIEPRQLAAVEPTVQQQLTAATSK